FIAGLTGFGIRRRIHEPRCAARNAGVEDTREQDSAAKLRVVVTCAEGSRKELLLPLTSTVRHVKRRIARESEPRTPPARLKLLLGERVLADDELLTSLG
ncbi:unnamed protein product, partial [Polarella glacialis]